MAGEIPGVMTKEAANEMFRLEAEKLRADRIFVGLDEEEKIKKHITTQWLAGTRLEIDAANFILGYKF